MGPPLRGLARVVRRSWEGGGIPLWLRVLGPPMGVLYRSAVAARGAMFDRRLLLRAQRVDVPVIAVGNLAIGGTGKTPVSAWLVSWLLEEGHSVALLTRGYGDDETHLHRAWNPDAPVLAGPNRVASARRAVGGGAEVLVLDDAFQHRSLARDLDIVLVAAEHSRTVRTLPQGPYREPLSALGRADVVIITRRTACEQDVEDWRGQIRAAAPTALVGVIDFRGRRWEHLGGGSAPAPADALLAVAGVAQPEAFRLMVEQLSGSEVELMAFDDHHAYDAADVERIRRAAGPRTVVTTEKDAVKLQTIQGLPQELRVLCLDIDWVQGRVEIQTRIESLFGGEGR
jgi:tetraacyldisaccharide 4'-kinase